MSTKDFLGALDASPTRVVVLAELLAAVDPGTLAAAITALSDHNQYTDADKVLVDGLSRYKGEFVDLAALEAAHPAASVTQSDAWAQLEGSDSFAVLDNDTSAWVQTTSPPASIDSALSVASTNPLTNQAITAAMNQRLKMVVLPIPGDGVLTSFNITHALASVAGWSLRKQVDKEQVGIKIIAASATVATVGPFASAPADGTVYELVITGL